jgi:DNA primase
VVEGVFDALALWPDAVAVLGKPSDQQVDALINAKRPVVIVLDGDAWLEGKWLAARLCLRGKRAGHIRLPPGVDPDEVDRKELEQQAMEALP